MIGRGAANSLVCSAAPVAAAFVVILALGSCSAPSGPAASEISPQPRTSLPVAAPSPAGESSAPLEVPHDHSLESDPAAGSQAVELAVAAVRAFCRPTATYEEWIAELYPFLTQAAGVAFETVDPANVPCSAVTGPGTVRDGDEMFTMRVLVPTDAGVYSVYAHRTEPDAAWGVELIAPLEGR